MRTARRGTADFDIIFCRNVLIYFDDASRRTAAENLYDCLHPGGFICLGHSETMSRISSLFSVCRFPDAIVYQKPEAERDTIDRAVPRCASWSWTTPRWCACIIAMRWRERVSRSTRR